MGGPRERWSVIEGDTREVLVASERPGVTRIHRCPNILKTILSLKFLPFGFLQRRQQKIKLSFL